MGRNEREIEERALWSWFLGIPISYIGQRKLIEHFKSPGKVMEASEQEISQIIGKIQPAIEYLKERRNTDWRKAYVSLEERGIHLTIKGESDYPKALQPLSDAPFGLYHSGRLPDEKVCVSIVGSRSCSRYGLEVAASLGRVLAEAGAAVISGMALGIDGAGQWAALEQGGRSYAVLGSGIDICYPKENRRLYDRLIKEGGLISEFPPGSPPHAWHFPVRNRIISGLSRALVVVEARRRSGSLITADLALEQGREIYAVPGRVTDSLSQGCNELIRSGAGIVLSPETLLEELDITSKYNKKNSKKFSNRLAENEKLVYSCLDLTPKSTEAISRETDRSIAEVTELLIALQLKGLAVETGIGYYALAGKERICCR